MPSKSLFPSPVKVLNQIPLASEVKTLGFSVPLPDPQVGKSAVGPRTFLQSENFFGVIVLQSMGHLLGGSMIGLIVTSSKTAYATGCMTQVCCSQDPVPVAGYRWPMRLQETLKHSKSGLAQALWGLWKLVCTRFCLSYVLSLYIKQIFFSQFVSVNLYWTQLTHQLLCQIHVKTKTKRTLSHSANI